MRYFFLFLLVGMQAIANAQSKNVRYATATFTDPDRTEKIQKLLPLVDSLYKAYAAKIHSPGFVYGVVVDGKLIGKGQ
ncbi:MAG TPA: hypothetical protein VFL47_14500, partial [Flavisolibacter sp.]|nr:hypothetical protein [Flavisolibacter sp.]